MASLEPEPLDVDIYGTEDKEYEWDDYVVNDLVERFKEISKFNRTLNRSYDEDIIDKTTNAKKVLEHDIIELVANQIYDKLTIYFNDIRKRLGIQKGKPIAEPIRNYSGFVLEDDGEISFISNGAIVDLGNINGKLKSTSHIRSLGVVILKSMGF